MIRSMIRSLRDRFTTKRPTTPRIEVILGDITKSTVDAIVNAAKPSLLGGGGVDGAIHAAGGPDILRECRALAAQLPNRELPTGQALITGSGRLPCLMVIHTVGPVFPTRHEYPDSHGDLRAYEYQRRAAQLRACYTNSLNAAAFIGARSIAFPLISSGVYGWPLEDAIDQAIEGILAAGPVVETVRLVLFDEKAHRVAVDRLAKAGIRPPYLR